MTQLPLTFDRSKTVEAVRQLITGQSLAPHTLHELLKQRGVFISAESVTARLRDLRKPQYGRYDVKKKRVGTYYEYSIQEAQ